uniref:Ataxin-10 domain-containing protein n=1 Tax=Tetradesmus obliquus TaxID=3088 RepID=A0A383VNF2_TETOB|eukprot:jgi/Sobl393_1/11637/SZX67055.1
MTQQQQQQQQHQEQHQEQHLAECLQLSKTGSGRLQLIDSGELEALCVLASSVLPSWETNSSHIGGHGSAAPAQQALMLLRVLRNACAAGPAAAEVLQANAVHMHAAQLAAAIAQAQVQVTTLDPEQCKEQRLLLVTALQLVANMCAAAAEAAAAVWAVLFPDRLLKILAVLEVDVHEVAALVVLYCVRAGGSALADMTRAGAAAGSIWLRLLAPVMAASNSTADSSSLGSGGAPNQQQQQHDASGEAPPATTSGVDTTGNDNLCLLVKAVALQHDCLQQVMQCLQLSGEAADGDSSAAWSPADTGSSSSSSSSCSSQQAAALQSNIAHAVLLHIVEAEVGTVPNAEASPAGSQVDKAAQPEQQQQQQQQVLGWLACLVGLVEQLSRQISSAAAGCDSVVAHVLEATLQASVLVLRAVVGREDAGRGLLQYAAAAAASSGGSCGDCVSQLHSLGLTQLVLGMLQQLPPPPKLREKQQQQQQQQPAALQQQQQQPSQQQPSQQQPYAGYRADLVALLSNMLYGRRSIQDELLASGGVEVLLNNCNLDDTAPLAREWALWSVRNMCRDNEAVQQYIAQFTAVEAVQSAELERMGKELQLDRATNKLSLVDKPKQQPQQ